MATLATHVLSDAGTAPTFVAASTSDKARINSGKDTFVVYKNASGSAVTVTIVAPGNTDYGQPYPDPAIVVAAAGERWIPMRKSYDPGDGTGLATLNLSLATSVTVAVVQVG